jgi:CelD/BcsL family acetyltransferase involved in cellulose biosynthesis
VEHLIHTSFAECEPLRQEWDDLAAQEADLYGTFDWCAVWWRHYGQGRHLEIHLFRKEGKLVAILPLFRETLWLGLISLHTVRLVGCDHALAPASLVIQREHVPTVMQKLLASVDQKAWDIIHFGPLRNYLPALAELSKECGACRSVGSVIDGIHEGCATSYDLPSDYQGYLNSLASHERKNIGRCERRLQETHTVDKLVPGQDEPHHEHINGLVELHQALWKERWNQGQFEDWPGFEAFHRDMVEAQRKLGRLQIIALKVDGETAGVEYGYCFGYRVHALIRGYKCHEPLKSFSLGRMLHCGMMEEGIRRCATLMDDGRGAFEYKHRLGGRLQCERSITLIRNKWISHARFVCAMRAAYAEHVLYRRIWFDRLRVRLHLPNRSLWRSWIDSSFLSQLQRRIRISMFRIQPYYQTTCVNKSIWCGRMKSRQRPYAEPAPTEELSSQRA